MATDSRIPRLLAALERLTERLSWFPASLEGENEKRILELRRSVLDEWALLEPHLELLEAVVSSPRLASLLDTVAEIRRLVRMEFLVTVGKLLSVSEQYWGNEMLMRMPIALKNLEATENPPPEVTDAVDKLRGILKIWPEPERMFRESMQAADNCEPVMVALHKKLLTDWPEEWTPEMQTRLEKLDPPEIKRWREELRREAGAL